MYNPAEVRIGVKKVKTESKEYFIGNCDMDVNIQDTVIKFLPPTEDERYGGVIIIHKQKERAPREDSQAK